MKPSQPLAVVLGALQTLARRVGCSSAAAVPPGYGLLADHGPCTCTACSLGTARAPALISEPRMCPLPEGTTTALQPLTVAVRLVGRHHRFQAEGVGYPPDGT